MATATLGLINHTEIDDADTNASWIGLTTADPDIKKEGTNSMSGVLRANGDNGYYDDGTPRTSSGKHLRVWINTTNTPYMQPESSNGYQVFVYDGTNTDYYTVFGSDTYDGGWFNAVVDCSLFTTVTPASVTRWGLYANHASNAKNATNAWVDFFRYTDGYYITGGTSGDKVRLSDVSIADKGTTTLYGYGIIEETEEVYFASGEVQVGSGSETTYFEMDGDVLVYTDKPVADGLYSLKGVGSNTDIVIINSTIKASGEGVNNRPDIDMSTGSPNSVSITGSVFIRSGQCTFTSGQTITSNTFNDCEQIYPGGADLTDCVVQNYSGLDTGALVYNVNADPDGELDNIVFSKGDTATHAIEFGTSSATTMTLRGMTFTGYNASDAQNDSTLYFQDKGTDTTWTINATACTGNISYKKARSGDTVTIVADQITHGLTGLQDNTEVTYMMWSGAEESGTAGATTADSKIFTDSSKSWTPDQFNGRALIVSGGQDAGRYYIYDNDATNLYLDTEMTDTASSLTYGIYDENDMIELYHVENVSGGETSYIYTYLSDRYADILIHHVNYEPYVLEDILLSNTDQSIPITQIAERVYYNPT